MERGAVVRAARVEVGSINGEFMLLCGVVGARSIERSARAAAMLIYATP